MSDLLDDGLELTSEELLSRYQRKFAIVSLTFVLIGTLWGISYYYIIEAIKGKGEFFIIALFFGVNLLLLLIYGFLLLKDILPTLLYTGIGYGTSLGFIIAITDEYSVQIFRVFGNWSLGFLCSMASLMSLLLLWILPLPYKKTALAPDQLQEIVTKTRTKYHIQLSMVFLGLVAIWGWGYDAVESYLEYIFYNEIILFYIITGGLIFLYKWFFIKSFKSSSFYTIIELMILSIVWIVLIQILDLYSGTLPYIVGASGLVIVAATYLEYSKIKETNINT